MSKIQRKIPIEVQNRSGFNCSHSNSFTAGVGTLTPILCDHVMPNTTINLDVACEVNLPPAISDFYGSIEARLEFFFVPYRTIWAGWKYFFVQPPQGGANNIPSNKPAQIQISEVPGTSVIAKEEYFGAGTLADFLGFKFPSNYVYQSTSARIPNILPFVGYHSIYDHYYRDPRITQPIFYPPTGNEGNNFNRWTSLPWRITSDPNSQDVIADAALFELHQRCWDKDYFTNSTYAPQAGDASSLEFDIQTIDDGSGVGTGTASFTISSLRVANALQRFAEVNGISGQKQADQQYARFGCYPADSALDRPLYLGQKRFNVYKRSVYQQSENVNADNQNPFTGILGNKTSALSGYGEGFMGKFHAKDAGLIYCIFSLVPQATYSTGTRRYLSYSKLAHFPEPLLQGTGDQPIFEYELIGGNPVQNPYNEDMFDPQYVFGYTQRYSEAKFLADEVHGILRDGKSLDMFQLQRSFSSSATPQLSTSFLEIPKNYLDQVTSADASVSEFGCWCNAYINYKKVQPLAAYSLPTLGDPKDTHTILVDNGGQRL